MKRRVCLSTAVLVFCLGCQAGPAEPREVHGPDPRLTGPWQPAPLTIETRDVERWHQLCTESFARLGVTGSLSAVDARGADRAHVLYGNPNGTTVLCEVRGVLDAPRVESIGGPNFAPPPAADELVITVDGGGLLLGAAGPTVTKVIVEVPGLPDVTPTFVRGGFLAWWPPEQRGVGILRITGYDAAGRVLDSKIGSTQ